MLQSKSGGQTGGAPSGWFMYRSKLSEAGKFTTLNQIRRRW
jgi:hypothetical protein